MTTLGLKKLAKKGVSVLPITCTIAWLGVALIASGMGTLKEFEQEAPTNIQWSQKAESTKFDRKPYMIPSLKQENASFLQYSTSDLIRAGPKITTPYRFWKDNPNQMERASPPRCIFTSDGGWGNTVYFVLYSIIHIMGESEPYDTTTTTTTTNTAHNNNNKFPCIHGFYRDIFGSLFTHLEACPLTDPIMYDCFRSIPTDGWTPIKAQVKEYLPHFPSLRQLNKTFVQEILGTACPHLLPAPASSSLNKPNQSQSQQQPLHPRIVLGKNDYCAIQIRFGDSFFRDPSVMKKPDDRICGKRNLTTVDECYGFVQNKIMVEMCPNTSKPIYVATDHIPFLSHFQNHPNTTYPKVLTCSADYLASKQKDNTIQNNNTQEASSSAAGVNNPNNTTDVNNNNNTNNHYNSTIVDASEESSSIIRHVHGVNHGETYLAPLGDDQVRMMLADWLGIILASELNRPSFSSTYRETAGFDYQIV